MLSSFGGTIALGGLVSITLLFGMLSNLVLLPSLVLTLNKKLANQQEFGEPTINILSDEEVGEVDKIELDGFSEEDFEEESDDSDDDGDDEVTDDKKESSDEETNKIKNESTVTYRYNLRSTIRPTFMEAK